MVQALIKGRKFQTRRIIKPQPTMSFVVQCDDRPGWFGDEEGECDFNIRYAPGDRLWVRENCWAEELMNGDDGVFYPADRSWQKIENTAAAADAWHTMLYYARKGDTSLSNIGKQVPSIHMPRWASRLTLAVTDVRVQRLNDISEADARAEGIERMKSGRGFHHPIAPKGTVHLGNWTSTAAQGFRTLWNSLHGPDAWDANPWVVALTFDVHRGNIDEVQP